jgi:hypothetical protein
VRQLSGAISSAAGISKLAQHQPKRAKIVGFERQLVAQNILENPPLLISNRHA